ncbi:hypothetical protein PoB_003569100 [Plakobranchus ocellatus]|uniref:Uncharacterized protein n=1 Tax=Plakobranchus ocellatus TaxID=259542 RepID=A0AAV4ALV8_9GAST|nr:hypothetical protein PoB_003569100 [Plakobranchus ocellatus]
MKREFIRRAMYQELPAECIMEEGRLLFVQGGETTPSKKRKFKSFIRRVMCLELLAECIMEEGRHLFVQGDLNNGASPQEMFDNILAQARYGYSVEQN